MEAKDCRCIVGYLEEDEHERTTMVFDKNKWNPKYFLPFKYCPLCGKLNEDKI